MQSAKKVIGNIYCVHMKPLQVKIDTNGILDNKLRQLGIFTDLSEKSILEQSFWLPIEKNTLTVSDRETRDETKM